MSRNFAGLVTVLFGLLVAGCAALDDPTDYNRHKFSTITIPRDRTDIFYFDVITDAQFPADDPSAEAARMKWLDIWMKVRQMCPAGQDVISRRHFEFMEDNPGHHDWRYEVKCRPVPEKKG